MAMTLKEDAEKELQKLLSATTTTSRNFVDLGWNMLHAADEAFRRREIEYPELEALRRFKKRCDSLYERKLGLELIAHPPEYTSPYERHLIDAFTLKPKDYVHKAKLTNAWTGRERKFK